MIRLHDALISGSGYKVRLLLAQLGIDFCIRPSHPGVRADHTILIGG
jgi:glutathione S-transferase